MIFEYKALEFNKILNLIAQNAYFDETKNEILNITSSNDINIINELLNETNEALDAINKYGIIPFSDTKSIYKIIKKLDIGSICSIDDFMIINSFILNTKTIINYFDSIKNIINLSSLEKYFLNITYFKKLKEELDKCISYNGTILDNASPDLYEIREKLNTAKNKCRNIINDLLAKNQNTFKNNTITVRNNKMCLPVKAEYKNTFKGIIHDESQTKSTYYIEPIETIEINANIISLENQEKIEIEKILKKLTNILANYKEDLKKDMDLFISLDIIYSKAIYANKYNCIKPILNEYGYTKLINAKHPLIDKDKIVPLNIEIGKDYNMIIITGPNTGGKSVSLKTVGLLTMMVQAGILIQADINSNINIYDNIFAHIGTEQSIEQSLSTFSASIERLVEITKNVSKNSLVLLDELGIGTDPVEGANLAISALDYFNEFKANVIATTHFSDLKIYAYNKKGVINASMEFDSINLLPTYRLLIGIPGKSNALEICERLGLDEKIINNAKLNEEKFNNEINETIDKLTKEAYLLEIKIKEYENLLENVKNKEEKMENEYNSYIIKAKKEANKIIVDAKEKADKVINELDEARKKEFKEHELANIKHLASNLKENNEFVRSNKEINVGMEVYVIPYNTLGEVISINKDKYKVTFGNLTMDFKLKDISFISNKPKPKKEIKKGSVAIKKQAKLELDLRGYRYEDAYNELDKFIDDALLSNYSQISIIHGFGTGVIRKMVHEYLKKCPYVKSYRYGGEGEGLQGVTIIYLK